MWSPTSALPNGGKLIFFISIHGLRVEPDALVLFLARRAFWISIHGLRVEPDCLAISVTHGKKLFQSTGSVWSPTRRAGSAYVVERISIHGLRVEPDQKLDHVLTSKKISIHGLRVEPDAVRALPSLIVKYFNPRAPCGARHAAPLGDGAVKDISIHGLRVEPDLRPRPHDAG